MLFVLLFTLRVIRCNVPTVLGKVAFLPWSTLADLLLPLFLCLYRTKVATNEEVAIKVLHLESVRDELDNIQKEISLLSRLVSVYVVQYIGSFLNGTDLNVVMEFMAGGSLRDLMKAGPLQEGEIAAVLREVLSGLVFLHGAHVVHRDIKAANILINAAGKVKIADFGVARELNATKRKFSVVGSPYWMAPEVVTAKDGGLYNEKADIWSLGITAIELAKCLPPRAAEKPMKVLVSIPSAPPPKLEGSSFSSSFKEFVAACLQVNPVDRPSAKELLSHPFITQGPDLSIVKHVLDRFKIWKATHPYDTPLSGSAASGGGSAVHGDDSKHEKGGGGRSTSPHSSSSPSTSASTTATSAATSAAATTTSLSSNAAGKSSSSSKADRSGSGSGGGIGGGGGGIGGSIGGGSGIGLGSGGGGSSSSGSSAALNLSSKQRAGANSIPFKKSSLDKFKAMQTAQLDNSVSDSVDDWDLSSNTRTSESIRDSESSPPSSPGRDGDWTTMIQDDTYKASLRTPNSSSRHVNAGSGATSSSSSSSSVAAGDKSPHSHNNGRGVFSSGHTSSTSPNAGGGKERGRSSTGPSSSSPHGSPPATTMTTSASSSSSSYGKAVPGQSTHSNGTSSSSATGSSHNTGSGNASSAITATTTNATNMAASGRPGPSSTTIKRPTEFSTLSASTDENQFGSVIVHQASAESESSSFTQSTIIHQEPLLAGINEGAGEEEEDVSSSMVEQQFGSIVIKSAKPKIPSSLASGHHHHHSTASDNGNNGGGGGNGSNVISPSGDRKTSSSSSKRLSTSTPNAAATSSSLSGSRPKSSNVSEELLLSPAFATTSDLKTPLKRERSKPKIDTPDSRKDKDKDSSSTTAVASNNTLSAIGVEPTDSLLSSTSRKSKSGDRASTSMSSPSLKDRSKRDKDSSSSSSSTVKTKRKKVVTPQAVPNLEVPPAVAAESTAALQQILLPVLTKRQKSSSGSQDKLSTLASTFASLEIESPGFTSDFLRSLFRKFEKEQKSIPSIGIQVVLNSTREEYSDLTKYLLARWKTKTDLPNPARHSNDDSYFL